MKGTARSPIICACGCGDTVKSRKRSARFLRGHRARSQFGSPEERSWAMVRQGEGCWLWQGSLARAGYGTTWADGKKVGAHRFSWQLHVGPIAEGLRVLHQCDTPACVNPGHLFLGTAADNTADMIAKERNAFGEKHPMARLREQEALTIRRERSLGRPAPELAARFRVSEDLIYKIAAGQLWKHLISDDKE